MGAIQLSRGETEQFLFYETQIDNGLKTFIEVGEALLKIKENKLYRKDFSTFEEYCKQRWDIGIRQSQRLMSASKVVQNLQEHDQSVVLPSSEYQVRALTKLPPEIQRQVWKDVTEKYESVTGKTVNEVIEEYQPTANNLNFEKHFSSKSDEWYTPDKIIEPTVKLMGGIDLDPCSNSKTNPNIPAKNHFTLEDDGLTKTWKGKVFLNPPYSMGMKKWIEKVHFHFLNGDVTEAIILVPARTDTQWLAILKEYPRCFVKGKLHFSGAEYPAPFPSIVLYLGNRTKAFLHHFDSVGDIYQLIKSENSM